MLTKSGNCQILKPMARRLPKLEPIEFFSEVILLVKLSGFKLLEVSDIDF